MQDSALDQEMDMPTVKTSRAAKPPKKGQEDSPRYVITLVHGTFAPGAKWTQAGSRLCKTLELDLEGPVQFLPFTWVGQRVRWFNNTHQDRNAAAVHLQEFLKSVVDEHPNAQHFIIGHSHGGSVAVQALRNPDLASRITGVVYLATPFLTGQRSNRDKFIEGLADGTRTFGWAAFICYMGIFAGLVSRAFAFLPGFLSGFFSVNTVTLLGNILQYSFLALWLAGAIGVRKWVPGWTTRVAGPWLEHRQAQLTERFKLPDENAPPTFIAYVKKDEARAAFRLQRWSERAMIHGYRYSLFLALFVVILICGVVGAARAGELSGSIVNDSLSGSPLILYYLLGVAGPVFVLFFLMMGALFPFLYFWPFVVGLPASIGRCIFFGPESIIDNWLFRGDVATSPFHQSTPFITLKEYAIPLQLFKRERFRHCAVYEQADVLSDLTDWIKGREAVTSEEPN